MTHTSLDQSECTICFQFTYKESPAAQFFIHSQVFTSIIPEKNRIYIRLADSHIFLDAVKVCTNVYQHTSSHT